MTPYKDISKHELRDGSFDSTQDGAHIYFCQYFPKGKLPKKILHFIFQHGAIEHHRGHMEMIDALREHYGNKIVISCMDLVGHGLSGGPRAWVKNFDVYIKDYFRFLSVTTSALTNYEVTTVLSGHSLGGMITLTALLDFRQHFSFPVHGIVMCSPCIRPNIKIPKAVLQATDRMTSHISKLRLPSVYDGFDLTTDHTRAVAFNHDHLNSHFMTIRMGIEILKRSEKMINLSYFLDVPGLYLISGHDKIVDSTTTKLFLEGVEKKLVNTKVYPGKKHDLLNETCRLEIFQEIIRYIDSRILK